MEPEMASYPEADEPSPSLSIVFL